jgi:uncharacterized repeat protein (TIGR01451 family)/LPXTG-motif cell wall-anchored protein
VYAYARPDGAAVSENRYLNNDGRFSGDITPIGGNPPGVGCTAPITQYAYNPCRVYGLSPVRVGGATDILTCDHLEGWAYTNYGNKTRNIIIIIRDANGTEIGRTTTGKTRTGLNPPVHTNIDNNRGWVYYFRQTLTSGTVVRVYALDPDTNTEQLLRLARNTSAQRPNGNYIPEAGYIDCNNNSGMPEPPSRYLEGTVEVADACSIRGWAWDGGFTGKSNGATLIRVYLNPAGQDPFAGSGIFNVGDGNQSPNMLNGTPVYEGRANLARPDVGGTWHNYAGYAARRSDIGFEIQTQPAWIGQKVYVVAVDEDVRDDFMLLKQQKDLPVGNVRVVDATMTITSDTSRCATPTTVIVETITSTPTNTPTATPTNTPTGTPTNTPTNTPTTIPNSSITVDKTVTDVNGGNVQAGDILEYSMLVRNSGNEAVINVVVNDNIPANTSYVTSSLQIDSGANAGSKTDVAADDQAEYDGAKVVFRVGTGANASTGGRLGVNETSTVSFRVQISSSIAAGSVISNVVTVTGTGENSGNPVNATDTVNVTIGSLPNTGITENIIFTVALAAVLMSIGVYWLNKKRYV